MHQNFKKNNTKRIRMWRVIQIQTREQNTKLISNVVTQFTFAACLQALTKPKASLTPTTVKLSHRTQKQNGQAESADWRKRRIVIGVQQFIYGAKTITLEALDSGAELFNNWQKRRRERFRGFDHLLEKNTIRMWKLIPVLGRSERPISDCNDCSPRLFLVTYRPRPPFVLRLFLFTTCVLD